MSDPARWLNWKPSGTVSEKPSDSPTKPSKPSKPAYVDPAFEKAPLVGAPPAAPVDLYIGEIAAYAKIGSSAPHTARPIAEATGGFDGFEGFVAQGKQKNVVEARLHRSGLVVFRPLTRGSYPEPTGFKTVVAGYGTDQVRYTVARHQVTGPNRFGQGSAEFPFCLLNLAARRRSPCDLRLSQWYRSEQEAVEKYAPPTAVPEPEPSACVASFACDVQVELRRENRSRWLMWEVRGGRRKRRTDFASPYLDHAKRTAVCWYGEPLSDWLELKDNVTKRRSVQ